MRRAIFWKWCVLAGGLTLLTCLGGCAGKASFEPAFWPASPSLPRIQYLRGIKDSSDIVEQKAFSILGTEGDSTQSIPLLKPFGIAVHKGKIYVTDTVAGDVLIIDLPNKQMSRLPGNKNMGKLKKPISVALDDDDNIYVVDSARAQVLQYDQQGQFVQTIAGNINMRPTAVLAEEEYIYILDANQHRILVLNRKTGELLREVGADGPEGFKLALPLGVAADGKGGLVTTNFDGRLISYDRDGHFLRRFGKMGQSFGEFGRPRGISIDKDGNTYIVDAAMQHVQLMDDQWRLLLVFGGADIPRASLNVPAGIAVSTDNLDYYQKLAAPDFILEKLVFVVSQFGDRKINIYGIGKKQGLDYDAEYKKLLESFTQKNKELADEKKKAKEDEQKGDKDKKSPATKSPAPGLDVNK